MAGLVVVKDGVLAQLNAMTAAFGGYKVGLFQNATSASYLWTIADVQPCTFSGYDGLHPLAGWITPAWVDPRYNARAGGLLWAHDGGAVPNYVYGAYVVNAAGVLQWVDVDAGGPRLLAVAGAKYEYAPAFSHRSEFLS